MLYTRFRAVNQLGYQGPDDPTKGKGKPECRAPAVARGCLSYPTVTGAARRAPARAAGRGRARRGTSAHVRTCSCFVIVC